MKSRNDQERSVSELIREIRLTNPYEFEPDSPTIPEKELYIIPDSYQSHQISKSETRSKSDLSPKSLSPVYPPPTLNSSSILTSEPSPRIVSQDSSGSSYDWRHLEGTSDYTTEKDNSYSTRRHSPSSIPIVEYYRYEQNKNSSISNNQHCLPYSIYHLESPSYIKKDINSKISRKPNSISTRSTMNYLNDIISCHESNYDNKSSKPTRTRSTTKNMFGEKGWLGISPDEILNPWNRDPEKSLRLKDKISIMEKLRIKLGEFAEKVDLNSSPNTGIRRESFHNQKVSIGPSEQAEIYMEVELMIVHTANSFLMNNFSRGRMSIDSIKKIVDVWKNKGHPGILEFMYDQATQRDLVALNQHNCCFHGKQAKNNLRITSMLDNWKQIASLMAIRTFCNADIIVFRILFDTELILESLGANSTILLRLQQIRNSALKKLKPNLAMGDG
ncbi:hypothetical protein HI914_02709 [Erysiphe necator]|nr:hypothetical protein HI914_02709 [Erysiphe necator]